MLGGLLLCFFVFFKSMCVYVSMGERLSECVHALKKQRVIWRKDITSLSLAPSDLDLCTVLVGLAAFVLV